MAVQILAAALSRAEPAHLGVEKRAESAHLDEEPGRQFCGSSCAGPVPMDRVIETMERPPAEDLL